MARALRRRLGPGLLTAYGVGVMVGAGIYVLVGAVAGQAGLWAPLSFLLAAVVAMPTALAFSELSARIPEAAGDSAYIEAGLGLHWLAMLVGGINIAAGSIAAAAVLRGGAGYFTALVPVAPEVAIIAAGVILTLIALVGVLESLAFAAAMTFIEVAGLLIVSWAGLVAEPVAAWSAPLPPVAWSGVIAASVFAFFAFIGFDDLVNMAEEAKNPGRDMPRTILASLTITAILYMLVTFAAVRSVPQDVLGGSQRPLALVWETATGRSAAFLSAIAVAAALNGILAQIVMASRVLFGLGRRSPVLSVFNRTHPRFGTPVIATVLCGTAATLAALLLPVTTLAEVTSALLLAVFAVVNLSLIRLKARVPASPFRVPVFVPVLGLLACLAALVTMLEAWM